MDSINASSGQIPIALNTYANLPFLCHMACRMRQLGWNMSFLRHICILNLYK